jgi:hypothetical protein
LIVFDAPGLVEAARINPEKVALLRSAATVVRSCEELAGAVRAELDAPGRLSLERRRVAAAMFYKPGTATDRAVSVIKDLLGDGMHRAEPLQESVDPHPLSGGLP